MGRPRMRPVTLPPSFGESVVAPATSKTPPVLQEAQKVFLSQEEKLYALGNIRAVASACKLSHEEIGRLCHTEITNILYRLPVAKRSVTKRAIELVAEGLGLTPEELLSPSLELSDEVCERVNAAAEKRYLFARKQGNFNTRNRGDL